MQKTENRARETVPVVLATQMWGSAFECQKPHKKMAACVYNPSTETAETSGSPELTSTVKDPFQEIMWKVPEKNT